MSAALTSKSTSDKKSKKEKKKESKYIKRSNYKITNIIMNSLLGLSILTCLIISYLYFSFANKTINEASNVSNYKINNASDFFNKETIKKIRQVVKNKDSIKKPNGRQNPFNPY